MKHIVLAFAALALLPAAARAETVETLGNGGASVTFPRGTPEAIGRKDVIWAVRDATEAFIASSSEQPADAELQKMFRTCPNPAEQQNEQGKITVHCWKIDGDPVKEASTAIVNGDLVIVRLIAHGGRVYQAQYVRRGGSGPVGADGQRFLASLRIVH